MQMQEGKIKKCNNCCCLNYHIAKKIISAKYEINNAGVFNRYKT